LPGAGWQSHHHPRIDLRRAPGYYQPKPLRSMLRLASESKGVWESITVGIWSAPARAILHLLIF
jgi:hypothetical protein